MLLNSCSLYLGDPEFEHQEGYNSYYDQGCHENQNNQEVRCYVIVIMRFVVPSVVCLFLQLS